MPGCSPISQRLHLARDNRRPLYQNVSSAHCCWDRVLFLATPAVPGVVESSKQIMVSGSGHLIYARV